MTSKRDEIFLGANYPKRFTFSEEVAAVFEDMLVRSIPLYKDSIKNICDWAVRAHQKGFPIIDIGCSHGTLIKELAQRLPDAHFIAIDVAPPMIEKAQLNLKDLITAERVEFYCGDACDFIWRRCAVVISNYTLQFIPLEKRKKLVHDIQSNLVSGGCFLVSEKITFSDPFIQTHATKAYEDFKLANGYHPDEVQRKKKALDGVLQPLEYNELFELLHKCGFASAAPFMQWHTFVSLFAQKN